ncbi:unnamed protein product [Gordionus sp. m RMFG-2023]
MHSSQVDEVYKIPSLCPNCEKQGLTQILPTNIPFFREVIITSFCCPHCNHTNNEIMQAEEIKTYGIRYILNIKNEKDYNRMIVKTDYATMNFPEIELEIPPSYQKAEITTIEGIIQKAYEDLDRDYGGTNSNHINNEALTAFIAKLKEILDTKPLQNFSFVLDDPSGNSFLENPYAPTEDSSLQILKYDRTNEQNIALGFSDIEDKEDSKVLTTPCSQQFKNIEEVKSEVL